MTENLPHADAEPEQARHKDAPGSSVKWATAILEGIRNRLLPVYDVSKDKEWQAAEAWTYKRFSELSQNKEMTQKSAGHEFLWDYGEKLYELHTELGKGLDDRADAVLKYLASLVGLTAVGAIIVAAKESRGVALAAVPSMIFSILAAYFAIRARYPLNFIGPASVADLAQQIDVHLDKSKAMLSSIYHSYATGARLFLQERGKLVKRAFEFYLFAVASLLLPVLIAIWNGPTVAQKLPTEPTVQLPAAKPPTKANVNP